MTIGLDQFLQNFDRCLLKLGNGDLPIAELRDSSHITPEYMYEILDNSGIAIRDSHRHTVEKIFQTLMQIAMLHSKNESWLAEMVIITLLNSSVDQIKAIIAQELVHGEAKFYPVLTVQVILGILSNFPRNSWTNLLLLDTLHITSTQRMTMSSCSCNASHPSRIFAIVQGSSLLRPPTSFSTYDRHRRNEAKWNENTWFLSAIPPKSS